MQIRLNPLPAAARADQQALEIVERKGRGHPDTICDALAEAFSRELSRYYLERFGVILHHNVDKVLLWGGVASPAFGGGEIVEPIELYLAGRATLDYKGVRIPVKDLAHQACERWLADHLHELDPRKHVRIHVLVRPGSIELVELFLRQQRAGVGLANDTSCGVGYAPLSGLEQAILGAERALVSRATTTSHPALGEDVKLMGVRRDERVDFTVACAMIGRHLENIDDYVERKNLVQELVRSAVDLDELIDVDVNTADDPAAGSVYLTVIGTSAEAGDDGQAGRGNRANGLITPGRPMTMESVAGKNPVTHVGKLYNVAAGGIAAALVAQLGVVSAAQCALVSQIGAPVAEPRVVDIRIATADGRPAETLQSQVSEIAHEHLGGIAELWKGIVAGEISFD